MGGRSLPETRRWSASLNEGQKDLQGLLLQLDSAAVFAQLARSFVHFERAKADNPRLIRIRHCKPRNEIVAQTADCRLEVIE